MTRTKKPPGPIMLVLRRQRLSWRGQQPQRRVIARHVDARELHDAVGDGAHRLADGGVDVDAAVRALAAVAVDAEAAGAQARRALQRRRDRQPQRRRAGTRPARSRTPRAGGGARSACDPRASRPTPCRPRRSARPPCGAACCRPRDRSRRAPLPHREQRRADAQVVRGIEQLLALEIRARERQLGAPAANIDALICRRPTPDDADQPRAAAALAVRQRRQHEGIALRLGG